MNTPQDQLNNNLQGNQNIFTAYFDSNRSIVIARPNWKDDNGAPVSDEFLRTNGIYPFTSEAVADTVSTIYAHNGFEIVDGIAHPVFVPTPRTLADAKAWLKNGVTVRRYNYEVGGCTVSGSRIATDDRSKALLNGAYNRAKSHPESSFSWKGENGFVTLSAEQIVTIGDAVADHVQACFTREKLLFDAIDAAEDIAALELIDIETGWPGQGG